MGKCIYHENKPMNKGYVLVRVGGRKKKLAHVIAWEAVNGPKPAEMDLDHVCHNEAFARGECKGGVKCPHRACINVEHLTLATRKENCQNGAKARHGFCKHGHEMTEENIYTYPNGTTTACRTCRAERVVARRAA